jgi:hypothetical protein
MDVSNLVNVGFGWTITLLSVTGFVLTRSRTGEKWPFWIVLATGWSFFAIAKTLIMLGVQSNVPYLIAFWLSSYVLVITSMVLLFLRLGRGNNKKPAAG